MPRVHFVKKARKDYLNFGIKKGDSYYYWEFRYGGVHKSKVRPRPSQLTQSEFLGTVYSIQEQIEDLSTDEDFQSFIDGLVEELETLRDDCDDKLSNMPDQLQDAPTGELLQNRSGDIDEMISELESIDTDVDEEKEEDETDDEYEERIEQKKQEILEEIQGVCYNGE